MSLKGRRFQDKKGFTLLEVMLSIGVMGIALIPIIESFAVSHGAGTVSSISKERVIVLNLARARMEEIMAMEFDAVDGTLSDQVTVKGEPANRTVLVEAYDGNGNGIVDLVNEPLDKEMKKITVTLRDVKLETLKSNR